MFNEENHPLLIGYSDEDRKGTELKSIKDVAEYIIAQGVQNDVQITRQDGTPFLNTFGVFIDRISDFDYREELLKVLVPMQQDLAGCCHHGECTEDDITMTF